MTTLTQEQIHNKPAQKAGFILLLGILVVSILITFRDIPSSTVAAVKPIPEIKYQPHAVEKHGSDALAILLACSESFGIFTQGLELPGAPTPHYIRHIGLLRDDDLAPRERLKTISYGVTLQSARLNRADCLF